MTLTQEEAHRLFEYREGELLWKIKPARCVNVGDVAGSTNDKKQPYVRLRIKNSRFLLHKVVFLMHHGHIPEIVDHINGDIKNNKIENLRSATRSQNHQNASIHKNNRSGCKNVSWHKNSKKWQVSLCVNRKKINLGNYSDLELADFVAQEARQKYFGKFSRNF